MKTIISLSFQHKAILILLVLMNLSFVLTGYMARSLTEDMILQEKQDKLLSYTRILDSFLGPGGFWEILDSKGAREASWEERLAILHQALCPITDVVGTSNKNLGVGYYSLELDVLVTYGPSEKFGHNAGMSIPASHPGHEAMRKRVVLKRFDNLMRGEAFLVLAPIERGGRVIGFTWANEPTTDIAAQINDMDRTLLGTIIVCFALTAILLILLSRRTVRDMDRIIRGLRVMRSDLSFRIEDSGGTLGEVVNSINDMASDYSKATEETGRAFSILRNVMSNVEAAVYVCDPQTMKLIYTNKYLRDLLHDENLDGKTCYRAIQKSDEPCSFCPQKQMYDDEGKPILAPVRWERHSDTLKRDFMVTDRLVTWHDGRLLHMGVATDVTERNALAFAEAAYVAQREFLARMSHEIRTPMNGVLGMTRLAMQADPPPAQLKYLQKIESSASILLGIINDILDFSRIEANKLSMEKHPFDLHEAIETIRELVRPRTDEKNLNLVIEVDEAVPQWVVGDDLRLSQVLLNLLGNASKFTIEGMVSLHVSADDTDTGPIRLYCKVADTGIGMTEEQMNSLFKPFSQADSSTSRKFGGTGLGLSISKALVELMGGKIRVTSSPGRGSIFSFSVLLDPLEGAPDKSCDRESWENMSCEGHTLLLVEDNSINQEIAEAILTDLGAEVDIANNGAEGYKRFLEKDYSLILMDVRMPVMDGLTATRKIRGSVKHDAATVPIIAMTANVMLEDREASSQAGMNGHIAKPIDMEELKRVLYEQLNRTC